MLMEGVCQGRVCSVGTLGDKLQPLECQQLEECESAGVPTCQDTHFWHATPLSLTPPQRHLETAPFEPRHPCYDICERNLLFYFLLWNVVTLPPPDPLKY